MSERKVKMFVTQVEVKDGKIVASEPEMKEIDKNRIKMFNRSEGIMRLEIKGKETKWRSDDKTYKKFVFVTANKPDIEKLKFYVEWYLNIDPIVKKNDKAAEVFSETIEYLMRYKEMFWITLKENAVDVEKFYRLRNISVN